MTDEVQRSMFEQALQACVEIGKLNGEQKGRGAHGKVVCAR